MELGSQAAPGIPGSQKRLKPGASWEVRQEWDSVPQLLLEPPFWQSCDSGLSSPYLELLSKSKELSGMLLGVLADITLQPHADGGAEWLLPKSQFIACPEVTVPCHP